MAKKTANIVFNKAIVADIRMIFDAIVTDIKRERKLQVGISGYTSQRCILGSLFAGVNYSHNDIKLRLIALDSFYSTNAEKFNYFAIDDMVDSIIGLTSRQAARDYFYTVANGSNDLKNLFYKPYGCRKNCTNGSVQTSLLSKYAYYELLQDPKLFPLGFPIYDSLVHVMYPKVCDMLGLPVKHKTINTIRKHVECLEQLRRELFHAEGTNLYQGMEQFDVLDAYLWRMGKFDNGNLSLLLGKSDYAKFVHNIDMDDYIPPKEVDDDKKKEFAFDKQVRAKLADTTIQPFKGCSCEQFMDTLLEHWRKYYA